MKRNAHLFDAVLERTCKSERELHALASELAVLLRPGDVVALSGPLGSGKTAFARALVRALHGRDQGTSPTFTFRHRYDGDPVVEHLDFYRIADVADTVELGIEEAFDGSAVVIVEWWRNAAYLLPPRRYEVEISGAGDGARHVAIVPPR